MFRIHICLDLENKAAELGLLRRDMAQISGSTQRRRRPFNKSVKHLTYTKVTQCGTEEYRRLTACKVLVQIKPVCCAAHQLYLLSDILRIGTQQTVHLRTVQTLNSLIFGDGMSLPLTVNMEC